MTSKFALFLFFLGVVSYITALTFLFTNDKANAYSLLIVASLLGISSAVIQLEHLHRRKEDANDGLTED